MSFTRPLLFDNTVKQLSNLGFWGVLLGFFLRYLLTYNIILVLGIQCNDQCLCILQIDSHNKSSYSSIMK